MEFSWPPCKWYVVIIYPCLLYVTAKLILMIVIPLACAFLIALIILYCIIKKRRWVSLIYLDDFWCCTISPLNIFVVSFPCDFFLMHHKLASGNLPSFENLSPKIKRVNLKKWTVTLISYALGGCTSLASPLVFPLLLNHCHKLLTKFYLLMSNTLETLSSLLVEVQDLLSKLKIHLQFLPKFEFII